MTLWKTKEFPGIVYFDDSQGVFIVRPSRWQRLLTWLKGFLA